MKTNKLKLSITGLLSAVIMNINAVAQTNSDGSSPQFLFPEFIKGEVRMKNGRSQSVLLNYNTVSEKMVYMQNEKVYDMIGTENVDTVYIYQSKFIPVGKIFHEVLLKDSITLLLQHKGQLLPPGKPAAYGGTSQVSSSTYMSSVELSSGYYNLDLPDDYEVKVDPIFWIRKDGNMTSYMTEKQFLKIFPEAEADLKKFIKQNRIKFDRVPDMIRLAIFYNEQLIK